MNADRRYRPADVAADLAQEIAALRLELAVERARTAFAYERLEQTTQERDAALAAVDALECRRG